VKQILIVVIITAENLTGQISNIVYCVCAKFLVSFHKTNERALRLFDWDRKQIYYQEL